MRDDLVDLVQDAAAEPLQQPDFDAMATRGRRQRTMMQVLGGVASALALLVAGVVLWPSPQPGMPVIGGTPTTAVDEDRIQLPEGWHELRVGSAVLGVPGPWEVETFTEPALLCSNMADRPTAYVATAGVETEGLCRLPARLAVTLEAVPLSLVPEPWLEPAAAILAWEPVTVNGFDGERLERDDGGPVRTYRFPDLDVWLRFAGPDSVTAEADAILATLADATSDRGPAEEGEPYDAAAQMRPDLMVVTPNPAVPGETAEITYPEETPRGVAFVFERQLQDGSWTHVYFLIAPPPARPEGQPQWFPANQPPDWQDGGVVGPGPDRVVVPETADPGQYRICTANAGDDFCTPLRVADTATLEGTAMGTFGDPAHAGLCESYDATMDAAATGAETPEQAANVFHGQMDVLAATTISGDDIYFRGDVVGHVDIETAPAGGFYVAAAEWCYPDTR